MHAQNIILILIAIFSLVLFAFFRNKQAARNDMQRDRMKKNYEELLEKLTDEKIEMTDQDEKETVDPGK
jgi:FtsZ-interacting cell division protein ZipA